MSLREITRRIGYFYFGDIQPLQPVWASQGNEAPKTQSSVLSPTLESVPYGGQLCEEPNLSCWLGLPIGRRRIATLLMCAYRLGVCTLNTSVHYRIRTQRGHIAGSPRDAPVASTWYLGSSDEHFYKPQDLYFY